MSFLGDNLGQPFNPNAGYTPAAVDAMNNNNAAYWANQDYVRNFGQSVIDQNNADWAAHNPASGYGTVGGYPSFGEASAPGTFSPGNPGNLSSYSGAPLGGSGGAIPSGTVLRGPDLPDISKPWINPIGSWEAGYAERNPDVWQAAQASGIDSNTFLQNHLAQFGMNEGRQVFDGVKYLQDNQDVAQAGMDPWTHYNNFGRAEGRPGEWGNVFDPQTYLNAPGNADIKAAGVDPLTHWLTNGIKEGRAGGGFVEGTPYNDFGMPAGTPLTPGGGLGQWGFGIGQTNYTGQPGFGLVIGSVGPNGQVVPSYGYAGDGLRAYPGSDIMGGSAFETPFGFSNGQNNRAASGWEADYLAANPDVARQAWLSGGSLNGFADQHYLNYGQNEGRSIFDADAYKAKYQDVAASGMDPLTHYLQFGRGEGREETMGSAFDPWAYEQQNPDVAKSGMDPLMHYLQYGQREGRDPGLDWSGYYDKVSAMPTAGDHRWEAEYLLANPDVAKAAERSGTDINAFADQHYSTYGQSEGRRVFDDAEYLRENPDVFKAGANPFEHYLEYGQKEGRLAPMSSTFDAARYLEQNPDVAAAGVDPLQHYLHYGQDEGRSGAYDQGGFTSDPNFDTAGYFKAHQDQYQAFLNANNQYTDPTAFAEMSNYESPSNDYSTFQKGPTYDWQSSISEDRRDPRVINAIYKAAGETKLPPSVIAAIVNTESRWNPGDKTYDNYGLPQMSENMWGDNPFRGTMGGVDFNTFKNDTVGDKQIGAYADWLIRGNKLNRDGIDVASVNDPVMQAAILQAIQFAGNSSGWRNDLAQGNMNTYVTTKDPQAKELRPGGEAYPTINSMYNAYDTILGGWRR